MDCLTFLLPLLHCFLLSHLLVIITSAASFQWLGLENKHLAAKIKSTPSHSRSSADLSKFRVQHGFEQESYWLADATSFFHLIQALHSESTTGFSTALLCELEIFICNSGSTLYFICVSCFLFQPH